jgi:sulfatase modifying factor 1
VSPLRQPLPVRAAVQAAVCVASLSFGCGDRTALDDERFPIAGSGASSGSIRFGSGSSGGTVASGSSAGISGSSTGAAVSGGTDACAETSCGALCVSCNDQCVDPQIDTKNCGGCGVACPVATNCVNGTCACPPGFVECVESGGQATCVLERGLQDDARNCGQCGAQCPAGAACQKGACVGPTAAPNCQPGGQGLSDCGVQAENCCATAEVEGSSYFRTYTNDGNGAAAEADAAKVSSFRLDRYLVTVGRFRQFVIAWNAGWLPTPGSGKHVHLNGGNGLAATTGGYEPGWVAADDMAVAPTDSNLLCGPDFGTWTPSPGGQENLPITCVTWEEAYAFCIWDGGFLPSEAEWEYAAAGGSQQREYPWGSTDPGTDNRYAIYSCNYPTPGGICSTDDGITHIAPVGTATLGAGLWGQLDLAGDAWELVLDTYEPTYFDPCTDCTVTASPFPLGHALRGSPVGINSQISELEPTFRAFPAMGNNLNGQGVGFRCARTP